MRGSVEQRFWAKVDTSAGPDGCWVWLGFRDRDGYGHFSVNRRMELSHRVSYRLANGEDLGPFKGCHSCDNPPCVNPKHIWKGTSLDNNRDIVAKNRHVSLPQKLTPEIVVQIRKLSAQGMPALRIAPLFNISDRMVGKVVRRECWKHVS